MAIVPLFSQGKALSEEKQEDEEKYLSLLHNTFASLLLYFSYKHDVTHTLQRLATMRWSEQEACFVSSKSTCSIAETKKSRWERADARFFWNRTVVSPLIACGANEWITPVMSAFIEARESCIIGQYNFTLLFISRRSRYRQVKLDCVFFEPIKTSNERDVALQSGELMKEETLQTL